MKSCCLWLLACLPVFVGAEPVQSFADHPDLDAQQVASGSDFLTPETRRLQADEFENPGFLWVERGAALFADESTGTSCKDCHAGGLEGAATRYPGVVDGRLMNLAGRINQCRVVQQNLPVLPLESDALLSLTAFVTNQSHGQAYQVDITGEAAEYFARGREYFFRRRGQLNLACNQCHDDNWGRMLRGDRLSQGQPTAWPAYRLEWQTFGSLHRRLHDCDVGVRATPQPAGSDTYLSLELYLAWRAGDLRLESPGVRR